MLKCQFHCHVTAPGHFEYIPYSPFELIDQAAKDKFDVLSITPHETIVFTKEMQKYATNKGILLIPGIEVEIGDGHILIINAHKDANKIRTFSALRKYKKNHPESFIIAAHPFFPFKDSLKLNLEKHIDLFDGIEHSYAHTKHINFNYKAEQIAKKHSLPFIATADAHILSYLNIGYTMVDAPKIPGEKSIPILFSALRKGHFRNHTKPTTIWKILKFFVIQIILRQIFRLRIK